MTDASAQSLPPHALISCAHCGQPTIGAAKFCCTGCEGAFEAIQGMGLGRYYEQRVLDAAARAPTPGQSERIDVASAIRQSPDGQCELNLIIEGVQCGACVWLIESVLAKQPAIIHARVNMTTRRLKLRWAGAQDTGRDLVDTVERLGYHLVPYDPARVQTTANRETKALIRALAVAGFAAGNLMLLSIGIWVGFTQGMGMETRALLHWASAIIALPAIAYAGQPFFRSAFNALRHHRTNMDVPISIGVILVTVMSLSETIQGGDHTYFDSAATLLFFLLIGRVLDQRARGRVRQAAEQLLSLRVFDVTVLHEDGTHERRAQERVQPGEQILVGMGERIGVDGVVTNGRSSVDASIVTGESLPVTVDLGDKVYAGAINLGSPLAVQVISTGEDTLLAECVRLIEAAEHGRGQMVALADRVARLYAPVVHITALATFLGWTLGFGLPWGQALLIAASVLIITCPCALALAVPAVQVIATSRLFRLGILVKSPTALERLGTVDTVVFDKTGTLSAPMPTLLRSSQWTTADLYAAASLAVACRHPLAKALVQASGRVAPARQIEEVAGKGMVGMVADGPARLGSRAFCGVMIAAAATGPELWFQRGTARPICFQFAESPRVDAAETIATLKAAHYQLELLSGDRIEPVSAMATQLSITSFHAGLSPVEKVAALNSLGEKHRRTLMVGDGLNDGPALASATVAMSPSSAADISQNVADIVFQGEGLSPVWACLTIAKRARQLIQQNLALSIGYNVLFVPLAIAGQITPWLAAAAMSGSSLLVILNSLRLERKKLGLLAKEPQQ